jgi:hypothetical protein
MEAYKGSRGIAPLILNLGTIPAMLYTIPMQKCYKQTVTQAIIPTVSLLWSWKEIVYGNRQTDRHTHTRYQHFDRQTMKRAYPWQRLLLRIGDKTKITRFATVWTTASTVNGSVRHFTAGLCAEQCRRLQNTDTDTVAQSFAACPQHDPHKTNVHHTSSVRTPGRIYTKFNTNISITNSDFLWFTTGVNRRGQRLATEWTVRGSNPGRGQKFFSSPRPSRPAQEPTRPPLQWHRTSFPGIQWPRHGVDHPSHLAPRLDMCGSIPLLPPLCLQSMLQRGAGIFTFTNVDKNTAGART